MLKRNKLSIFYTQHMKEEVWMLLLFVCVYKKQTNLHKNRESGLLLIIYYINISQLFNKFLLQSPLGLVWGRKFV